MSAIGNLIILLALVARLINPALADLSFFLLAGYALMGYRQVILAFALSWLLTLINTGLAPEAAFGTLGRYAVLLAGVSSVAWRGGFMRHDRFQWFTLLLGGFFVLHSMLASSMPEVSILKALSWMLTMGTLTAAWSRLHIEDHAYVKQWLSWFLLLIAVASLPLMTVPDIGYLRNGTGFQGVLNHPQALGPTMALLGALVMGLLLAQKRPAWTLLAIALGCLVLIMASEARTAGIALVFAVLVSIFVAPLLSGLPVKRLAPALHSKRFIAIGLISLALFAVAGQQLSSHLDDFISKSGRAGVTSLTQAYDVSRGRLIDDMLANVQAQPWSGIGFGIASDPRSMVITRDPVINLPVGAAIEKGVAPLAVLEEVGVPGFALVMVWIGLLLKRAASNGMSALILAITALLMNMGESTLFSPGGMGLLSLIFLSLAANSPPRSTGVGVLRNKTTSRA